MCQATNTTNSTNNTVTSNDKGQHSRKLRLYALLLVVDVIISLICFTPWIPDIPSVSPNGFLWYSLAGTLWDLAILSAARVVAAMGALFLSFQLAHGARSPYYYLNAYHANGDLKSQEDLELEALEQPALDYFKRLVTRPDFTCQLFCVTTQFLAVAKCLARLDVEVGRYADAHAQHVMFWITVAMATALATLELLYLDSMCTLASQWGKEYVSSGSSLFFRRVASHLSVPLLAASSASVSNITDDNNDGDEENQDDDNNNNTRTRVTSDITADPKYKASFTDLLSTCSADLHYIAVAFVFLLLAALAQVYIPKFTGDILDSLNAAYSQDGTTNVLGIIINNSSTTAPSSVLDVPGFVSNVKKLVVASALCGIFSGIRGSIFTLVGGRVNVRLRVQLMDALLAQDIGFFDTTKTGDITSRLSSDTTLVGDQVTLNVNVFLRSVVQAIGVLIFMCLLSWQLTIIAFISVPVITALSKWYGSFIRSLTKLMQKKLADGNSVSEAVIGSMATVRSFDAATGELKEFETCMRQYLWLNTRSAIAYVGYASCVTALPYLVIAVVLFYGGLLVRNGDMTNGQLVSFILYLQSLSDAFGSIGYIFAALTQAVGAADKVFEMMHRKPRLQTPTTNTHTTPTEQQQLQHLDPIVGVKTLKTETQREMGLHPPTCRGEVVFENVDLSYPARPDRQVLNKLSLKIPPGSVVALVGQSGGGKSSVMSLLQHMYDPSSGRVLLDGHEVSELSPSWLSQNVSIVSQEPTLFARSIKRNIIFGLEGTDREPSDEEVREAAWLANASSFIEQMPSKYEEEVGERGVQLSGGQKQRIAIARALVRKPRVLLLDEATSALDSESEHVVQQAIDGMIERAHGENGQKGMTVIMIAHRLSTVRNADVIFVIQKGQVVEQGRHDELLQKDGYYAALVRRQIEAQEAMDAM